MSQGFFEKKVISLLEDILREQRQTNVYLKEIGQMYKENTDYGYGPVPAPKEGSG